ncbi:hypothetical protein HNO89_002739 [Sporosarcina luteola]|nr:hypothetical protein [Sporosarcina luteola]
MAKPKQTVHLLGRMAKEIEKMLMIKGNADAFPSFCLLYMVFVLRLVWYDGLPQTIQESTRCFTLFTASDYRNF